jgi:hypothetical protein
VVAVRITNAKQRNTNVTYVIITINATAVVVSIINAKITVLKVIIQLQQRQIVASTTAVVMTMNAV